jgi:hypothetical protein
MRNTEGVDQSREILEGGGEPLRLGQSSRVHPVAMAQRKLLLALLFGLGVTAIAFVVGFMFQSLRPISDAVLAPGYALPEAYWGGVHDPLQILLAVTLNITAYGAVALLAMFVRAKLHLGL